MQEYLRLCGSYTNDDEPLFLLSDRTNVTMDMFHAMLRNAISRINLDPMLYDCHSFRIGCATDLYKANFSLTFISRVGRWRSNAVYKYLRN